MEGGSIVASVSCIVFMLSSSTESLSSISLFVYCASTTPPMMSHSQLVISNQCRVLHPPLSFFFSPTLGQLDCWLLHTSEYPNTVLFQSTAKWEKQSKSSFSAPCVCVASSFLLSLALSFFLWHASHLQHAKLCFPFETDPSAKNKSY